MGGVWATQPLHVKPWKYIYIYILLLPGNLYRGTIPCGGLGPGDLRLGRKSEESAMKNVTDMCVYYIYIYSVYECIYVCIHIHIHIWYDIICITRATDTESLLWKSIIGKTNFNGGQHQFISWNEAGYLWYSKNTEWFLMQYFYVSLNSCIVIESDLQSQDECSPKELTCRFYFSFTRNLWRVYLSSIIFHRKKKVIKKIFLALQQLQHVTLVCLKILLMEEILHQLSIQR